MRSQITIPWSLLPNGCTTSIFFTSSSSLVKIKSSVDGSCPSLNLVGVQTCWYRKQSLIHSWNLYGRDSTPPPGSFSGQFISLTLKSPIKRILFCPANSLALIILFINSSLFSSLLEGLLYMQPTSILVSFVSLTQHHAESSPGKFASWLQV
ncbi:unnamed protein product [Meganyctiphanes norvegica]|uniref:Uncharacterized protein n=1 Tax=Meganyctiphanes norvegica TaxID=48144 RepID=A0AAV2SLG3_MEGNR